MTTAAPRRRRELRREAATMMLYVSVTLLAAATAAGDVDPSHTDALAIVWGTTLGLALAHWFAFRVATRLVTAGRITDDDAKVGLAQLVGALAVAVLLSIVVLVVPRDGELDAIRVALATLIGLSGFGVARHGGVSMPRSLVYGGVVLAGGLLVAFAKNLLGGH